MNHYVFLEQIVSIFFLTDSIVLMREIFMYNEIRNEYLSVTFDDQYT